MKYIVWGLVKVDSYYVYSPIWNPIGFYETLEAAKEATFKIVVKDHKLVFPGFSGFLTSSNTFITENLGV